MKRTALFAFLILICVNIFAQGDGQYHQIEVSIDGLNREYWLYVPPGHDGSEEWPVVFMFHGLGVSLDEQNQISQWYNVADTAKFLIAWPVGLEVHDLIFNVTNSGWVIPGLTEASEGQDDLAFVDQIIDNLDANPAFAIDEARIYAAGFSSGADMAFYLACAFSDRITAVAGVGGQMTHHQVSQENNYCNPARPISVLQILGTEDPYYPIDGTEDFLPLFGTSKFWADNNNCDTMPQSSNIANTNTNDNSTVTLFVYDGCEDEHEVYFYRVNGGGHTWPGGTGGDGVINFDIHASVEIWNFFNRDPNSTNHPGASYCGPYTLSEPISYDGVSDITISELEISNPDGNCISLSNCHNVIIEKCKLGPAIGNGVDLYNCSNITVVDCRMDSIATGVYANECQGVSVTNIEVTNVQGPLPRGQMVQFNNVNGAGNRVNFNVVENNVGESGQEDAINMFQSNGTINSPIQIIGNWIRGGGPSNSGGGILIGDAGGSNFIVQKNRLVDPGQYGIGVASGTNIQILNNQVFANQQDYTNVGIYVWNQYSSDCNNITVMNNEVNWTNSSGNSNGAWDGANCGIINGWGNNDWQANINETILPEQIVLDCSVLSTNKTIITNGELIEVFPNPTPRKIFFSPKLQNSSFSIFSIYGQKIRSGKIELNSIDLRDLNKGIYLVKIINNESNNCQGIKVVKE